ncbi:Mucin-3B [Pteropus alecto]|uniref:Mucin-3B n=1 Tax=Pteropus alecto TaxID=9402 RepID=L5K837_PTEAL|nr:Mucin-3B [Pteropus alecto]
MQLLGLLGLLWMLSVSLGTTATLTSPSLCSTVLTGRKEITNLTHVSQSILNRYSNFSNLSIFRRTKSGTTTMAMSPYQTTLQSTSSVSPTPFPSILGTSTNAIISSFSTVIFSSLSTIITSPFFSSISENSMLTNTTNLFPTSLYSFSTQNPATPVTTFPTPFSSETTRTSPSLSSLTSSSTKTTATLAISSITPCPESISITIVPTSPITPCIEIDPNSKVTSTPTIPLSFFTSTTEMATTPSIYTSMTTVFPTHTDTSTLVLETDPTNIISDVPSSLSTGTFPINTVLTSTQGTSSETSISTYSVTTPHVPSFTSLPATVKPSSSLPTATTTSSKLTSTTPVTTRAPEKSVATTQTPANFLSSRTTSTTTQMITQSRLTTTPGTCDNGGTWIQDRCLCPSGFSGDRCELQRSMCQNGGQWDGLKCRCSKNFYGSRCEFAVDQVELDTVDAEVGMEVSVQQDFTSELNDNTSEAYMDFSKTFRNQMQKIYQNVQGFKDVEILSLRNGSIVVDYLVLLELPFSAQMENTYENVKMTLKKELQNVSEDQDSCQNNQVLCFKPDSIKVNNNTRTELTPEALCRRAAPQGYEDFYFPLVEENQLRCVTNCTSGVDGAIDCNQGQCFLERSGPSCRCFSTDTYWFSGPRCEVAIAWKALVGGLVGAAALLLLLLALSVFVVRSRSRRKNDQGRGRSWDDDKKWFEMWDENTVGTFTNSGFEDDRTVKEENFHVALENVDTSMRVRGQKGMDGKELSQIQLHISLPPPSPPNSPQQAELGPEDSDLPVSLSRMAPSSHSLSQTLCGRYTPRDLRWPCPHREPCTTLSTLLWTSGRNHLHCVHFERWSRSFSQLG